MIPATETVTPAASKRSPTLRPRRAAKCLPSSAESLRFFQSSSDPDSTLQLRGVALEAIGRHAAEGDHVEAGAAVVDDDLDRDHLAHAVDLADLRLVVLGQAAGGGAEAVLAVDDQRGVLGADLGGVAQAALHRLDGREQEHPHGDAEDVSSERTRWRVNCFSARPIRAGMIADHGECCYPVNYWAW